MRNLPANSLFLPKNFLFRGKTAPISFQRELFFTKRKKDLIEFEFEFGDSGKTAYFAAQVENEGEKRSLGRDGFRADPVGV